MSFQRKTILLCLSIFKFYILLYTYSSDQAKNVFHVIESRHWVQLDFLVPSIYFRFWNRRGAGNARKHVGRGVLKTSQEKFLSGVHNKLED